MMFFKVYGQRFIEQKFFEKYLSVSDLVIKSVRERISVLFTSSANAALCVQLYLLSPSFYSSTSFCYEVCSFLRRRSLRLPLKPPFNHLYCLSSAFLQPAQDVVSVDAETSR